jgi:hypothetical protein
MPYSIRGTEYYRATVADRPEEAYTLLSDLAELGVSQLAFTAIPSGPDHVQLTLFPDDPSRLEAEFKRAGLALDGPHPAILVQGDDELGALAGIHRSLADGAVSIYASSGVTDGHGSFGYVIYVREEHFDRAMEALGADKS